MKGFISRRCLGTPDTRYCFSITSYPRGGREIGEAAKSYTVHLSVANPAGALALTFLDSDLIFDSDLWAVRTECRGEIVSHPTANQHEALIEQDVEIPDQGSFIQWRDDLYVQESGSEPEGDTADHTRQSPDSPAGRFQEQRWPSCAEHRQARGQGSAPGRYSSLGYLFKSTTKTDHKDEPVMSVTPRILHEGSSLY